jgi:Flp pilus assembly protein TadG
MKRQGGTTTVEFALIAMLFFILLFGIIEFGRLFFVWNTLNEGTRRGARVAAVSAINAPAIANVAVFQAPGGGGTPVLPGLSTANVRVRYLDDAGAVLGSPNQGNVRFVEVAITGYQHSFMVPLFYTTFTVPEFRTSLPRESLGVVPD